MLVSIWIISSTIIVNCFASLLLNTYFHIKSVPLIDSIEDLVNNKQIMIHSHNITLEYIKKINTIKLTENDIDELINRKMESDKILNILIERDRDDIVVDIVNGKSVLMSDSISVKQLFQRYICVQDKIVSTGKYLFDHVAFFIDKRNIYIKNVKFA